MTFRVVHQTTANPARSPNRVIEQTSGREFDWVNRYLDLECLRRVADLTLRSYAQHLLHFIRWWESVHHTDAITEDALTESTLLEYVRFQSGQQPEFSGSPSTNALPSRIAPCAGLHAQSRKPLLGFSLYGMKQIPFREAISHIAKIG
jgi:hypothetical protein